MDRKIVLTVLAATVLGIVAVWLLMPPTIDDGVKRLPWATSVDADGHTRAFGFALGRTTLAEVQKTFGDEGTLNLFEDPASPQRYAVEAFFEQVYLQGLRANFVMTLDVDQETLAPMYQRGLRISKLESGARKVKLDPADAGPLADRPIRSIAYLPQATLEDALIEKRFGQPAERRTEPKTGVVHWLYPDRGMDLARDPDGHVVIQYANRSDFSRLTAALPPADRPPPEAQAPTEQGH